MCRYLEVGSRWRTFQIPLCILATQLTNVEREKPITDIDSSLHKSFMDHFHRVPAVEAGLDVRPDKANETHKIVWVLLAKTGKHDGQIRPSHSPLISD